jgi:hypothetical protein
VRLQAATNMPMSDAAALAASKLFPFHASLIFLSANAFLSSFGLTAFYPLRGACVCSPTTRRKIASFEASTLDRSTKNGGHATTSFKRLDSAMDSALKM